jgi:hypothetical protein
MGKIGIMKSNLNSSARQWWDDQDPSERDATLHSMREERIRRQATGWRRNFMLGVIALAVPILFRLVSTM